MSAVARAAAQPLPGRPPEKPPEPPPIPPEPPAVPEVDPPSPGHPPVPEIDPPQPGSPTPGQPPNIIAREAGGERREAPFPSFAPHSFTD